MNKELISAVVIMIAMFVLEGIFPFFKNVLTGYSYMQI